MGGGKGGGVLGGVTQTLFGDAGAGAAQGAAMAQLGTAQANYNTIKGIGDQMTTQGLASYDKSLSAASDNLSRQEEMIKQIDPTILAASQNALKLLQGQASPYLQPIQQQRDQQRSQLLNSLREQMGSGAETSTAGRQALNNFDMQTNQLTSQQQQSALGQLGGVFGQFSGAGQAAFGNALSGYNSTVGQRAGLQQTYAEMLNQANAPVYQSAGAQYTGAALRGQQGASFGQQLFGYGVGAGAGALSGGTSGAGKGILAVAGG